MTNKSIRDYINLIENAQREDVTEGKPGFDGTDAAGRPVDQELVRRQEKYWNQAAKEKKQQELKRSKELRKPGVAEEQLEETTPDAVAKVEQLFRHK